jgi:hypothetical protein
MPEMFAREPKYPVNDARPLQYETTDNAEKMKKFWGKLATCPVCGINALVTGKTIRSSEPRLEEGLILQDHVVLPTAMQCYCCGLTLNEHGKLHVAELGGEYTVTEEHDPVEFHQIDFGEYYGDEYGND